MEDTPITGLPSDQADPGSAYMAYMAAKSSGADFPAPAFSGMPGGPFDIDPFAAGHTGTDGLGSSNSVPGVVLADGTWADRATLETSSAGRKLLKAEEDIRRGHKRNFFDVFFNLDGLLADFLPFFGMFARVGGDISDAADVMDFYNARMYGQATTFDQALKTTLYERENELQAGGTTGALLASIIRQAPSLCFEFGIIGQAQSALRSSLVRGITSRATDEAARSASRYALARAVKIGTDEASAAAAKTVVSALVRDGAAESASAAAKMLSANPSLYASTLAKVESQTLSLVKGAANAVARPSEWAPGLAQKVAHLRADASLKSTLSLMSKDTVVGRMWAGLLKHTKDAAAEGLLDMGSWGSEAATVLTTDFTAAKAAAAKALTDLTVGAAAKGAAMFIPRTAVTYLASGVSGGVSANELSLKSAAYNRNDEDLFDRAWGMGMFMDLLEYVSENTGRGFNGLFRAAGLKFAPGLVAPAAHTAGLAHVASANLVKDAAGAVSDVTFEGFIDAAKHAEAGGIVRRFCEKAFSGRSLRDSVAADRFTAVADKLKKAGVRVGNPAALQTALETGAFGSGVSADVRAAIGQDILGFAKRAVKEYNRAGVEQLKTKGYLRFVMADFMARHNWDPMTAYDALTKLGYDGVVGEMLEERYSDFASGLFGLDANTDHSFSARLKSAVQGALAMNEDWTLNLKQLCAEAAGFAVPGIARMLAMRAIAACGSENAYAKMRNRGDLFLDVSRVGTGSQWKLGSYLEDVDRRVERFRTMESAASAKLADAERRAASPSAEAPVTPSELESYRSEVARAKKAAERLADLKQSLFDSLAPDLEAETGVKPAAGAAPEAYLAALSPEAAAAARAVPVHEAVVTDEELMSSDVAFDVRTRGTNAQVRQAMGAYAELVEGAGEHAQGLFKAKNRDPKIEGKHWFRRAAKSICEYATRMMGMMATGDLGFMSVNPARWSNVDHGMPDDIPDALEKGYQSVFKKHLDRIQSERASAAFSPDSPSRIGAPSQSDYDAAHDAALKEFAPVASELMINMLARHHIRMFSRAELTDVAMDMAAEERGLVRSRSDEFHGYMKPDGTDRMSYDDFVATPGVKDRMDALVERSSAELHDLVVRGLRGDRRLSFSPDGAIASTEVLTVPADLPTANQAILAKLISHVPSLRDAAIAVEADGSKTAPVLLGGFSVRRDTFDAIARAVLPNGSASTQEDLAAAYHLVETAVDPAVLEDAAKSLNYPCDGSRESIEERNKKIVRHAILATMARPSGDVAVFARPSTSTERDSRLGPGNTVYRPAGRINGKWTATVPVYDSDAWEVVTADTYDSLASVLAGDRYRMAPATNASIVYTSAQIIKSDDAMSMIQALGLGSMYRARMEAAAAASGNPGHLDPLVRQNPDGMYVASGEDAADAVRDHERRFAAVYEAAKKQPDWTLYLRPGETPSDAAAAARAQALLAEARRCWDRMYERAPDGRAIGYIAVADDFLRECGIDVPFSDGGNAYGLANQAFRDKYVCNLRVLQSVGATANVYIPINHGSAQDYESALLEASLLTSYANGRHYVSDGPYAVRITDFMKAAAKAMREQAAALRTADGNERIAGLVDALRAETVDMAESGGTMGPQTFSEFVSALCLFRTEVSGDRLESTLGRHAAALAAVAPKLRSLPSYVPFCAAVDRILGGTGFEPDSAGVPPAGASGLATMYNLFHPQSAPEALSAALASAVPGGSYKKFVEQAAASMNAADREAFRASHATAGSAASALNAIRDAARATGRTMEEVAAQASEAGGDAGPVDPPPPPEPTPAPEPVSAPEAGPNPPSGEPPAPQTIGGVPVQVVDVDDDDGDFDVSVGSPEGSFDVDAGGERPAPKVSDVPSLLPSQAKAVAGVVARLAVLESDLAPERLPRSQFDRMLSKLVPDMRKADRKMVRDSFAEMKDAGDGLGGLWSWGSDYDEEGVLPDGYEGNNQKSLSMVRSKAVTDLLAIVDLVSPTSGRDFQPFVADLRSSIEASSWLLPEDAPDELKDAYRYLDRIVNPRKEDSVDGAASRNSVWRHRMTWLDPASPQNRKVAKYVKALLGGQGNLPVNARAAVFLAYLSSIPTGARLGVGHLVGFSAEASPVRLLTDFPVDPATGRTRAEFTLSQVSMRGGHVSLGTLTRTFSSLVGKNGAEISAVADRLEEAFALARQELADKGVKLALRSGDSVFGTYARILAKEFGSDCPLVTMLVSRPLRYALYGEYRSNPGRSRWERYLRYFTAAPEKKEIPSAAEFIVGAVRLMAKKAGALDLTATDMALASLTTFESGPASERNVSRAATSLQGSTAWNDLVVGYSEAKPATVMTAETDPERTSRPESSLAISMTGLEPMLQMFMDRRDGFGFEDVVNEFGSFSGLSPAACRAEMRWPDAYRTPIVAKSVSKSATLKEVLAGCRRAFEVELDTSLPLPRDFERRNIVYVPVFSGDHSSSFIAAVPYAAQLYAKFSDGGKKTPAQAYTAISRLVNRWIGLDLLAGDAKRSFITSGEMPSTSMFDFRYDENGDVLKDAEGKPMQGHFYVGVFWNSEKGADREAMKGTVHTVGYGAHRQKETANDPKSDVAKFHTAATGADKVFGPVPQFFKGLSTLSDGTDEYGTFTWFHPLAFIDRAAKAVIRGEEDISSCQVGDWDSLKVSQLVSKAVFTRDGKGKQQNILDYVFGRIAAALDGTIVAPDGKPYDLSGGVDTVTLDEIVGEIAVENLAGHGKSGNLKLSDLVPGARLVEVDRTAESPAKPAEPTDLFKETYGTGESGASRFASKYGAPAKKGPAKAFMFVFNADECQAFTAANVSHVAKVDAETASPRNYMMDAKTAARLVRTVNADAAAGRTGTDAVFKGKDRVCDTMDLLVSCYGLVSAVVAADSLSLDLAAEHDEKTVYGRDHGEHPGSDYSQDAKRREYATRAKRLAKIPFPSINAPLVSNMSWYGDNGVVRSHSTSPVFNDLIQGARVIGSADVGFYRAYKHDSLHFVNCVDKTFRYGMYVDSERILSLFSQFLDKYNASPEAERHPADTEAKQVTVVLDSVISNIVNFERSGKTATWKEDPSDTKGVPLRRLLAECLIDHRGGRFSDRRRTRRVTAKDADGNPLVGADGKPVKKEVVAWAYDEVSYEDLFTSSTVENGNGQEDFDRAAVYPAMTSPDGKVRPYLGGTLFGFPRTPSYTTLFNQSARASAPLKERVQPDGQWLPGVDAMDAPDAGSNGILGSDHDGDKSHLSMDHKGGRRKTITVAELTDLMRGSEKAVTVGEDGLAVDPAWLDSLKKRLVDGGYIAYSAERKRNPDGTEETVVSGLELTADGRDAFGNLFTRLLRDLGRMAPVEGGEEGAPYFTGNNASGHFNRMTRAVPSDGFKEDMADHLAPPVIDVANGRTLDVAEVSAAVQTGAQSVMKARAIIVAQLGAINAAFNTAVGSGLGSDLAPVEFMDFIYHLGNMSDMTFDDMKEQMCSRLGVSGGMVDVMTSFFVWYSKAVKHGVPRTDGDFVKCAQAYADGVNGRGTVLAGAAAASDPANYEFRRAWYEYVTNDPAGAKKVPTPSQTLKKLIGIDVEDWAAPRSPYFRGYLKKYDPPLDVPPEGTFARVVHDWCKSHAEEESTFLHIVSLVVKDSARVNGVFRGMAMAVMSKNGSAREAAMAEMAGLAGAMDDLRGAHAIDDATSYAFLDPADPKGESALSGASLRVLRDLGGEDSPEANAVFRMAGATELLSTGPQGPVLVSARSRNAALNFVKSRDKATGDFGSRGAPGAASAQALHVMALHCCPKISENDVMKLESNGRSLPFAYAAFDTVRNLPGSPITSANAYRVLMNMGLARAELRHPTGRKTSKRAKGKDASAVGTNLTLDVRAVIEEMADLVGRFVVESTAHDELPVFGFLHESPDATARQYDPGKYGDAAFGLTRLGSSLRSITGDLADVFSGLYTRVVDGRELDSDGAIGRKPYESAANGFKPRYPLSFALSVDNLKAMRKFLGRGQAPASKLSNGKFKPSSAQPRGMASGSNRDLAEVTEELIAVFTKLEGAFGKGFKIEPSALFGQLIPLYLSFSDVVLPPAEGSSNLVHLIPGLYGRWSRRIAEYRADPAKSALLDLSVPVDFSSVVATERNWDGTSAPLRAMETPQSVGAKLRESAAAFHEAWSKSTSEGPDAKAARSMMFSLPRDAMYGVQYESTPEFASPSNRHTLSIFDDARAVLFSTTRVALANPEAFGASPARPIVPGSAPAPAPAPVPVSAPAPVVSARPAPSPAPAQSAVSDDVVKTYADRMGALMKLWDKGRVEYSGGNTFTLKGRFVAGEAHDTAIKVTVVGAGESVRPDGRTPEQLVDDPAFQRSMSNRLGTDFAALPLEKRLEYARQTTIRGFTFVTDPGEPERPGDWTLSGEAVGALCGEIRIREDAGGAAYHEMFHAVMKFMKGLGAFSDADLAALRKKYPDKSRPEWFDEENAADDYRAFVETRVEAKETKGFFRRLLDLVTDLYRVLFGIDRSSGAYANDMGSNPLVGIMLTGRAYDTRPPAHVLTTREKVAVAMENYWRSDTAKLVARDAGDPAVVYEYNSMGVPFGVDESFTLATIEGEFGNRVEAQRFLDDLYAVADRADADPANAAAIRKAGAAELRAKHPAEILAAYTKLMNEYGPRPPAKVDAAPADGAQEAPGPVVRGDAVTASIGETAVVDETAFDSDMFKDIPTATEEEQRAYEAGEFDVDVPDPAVHRSLREALRTVAPDRMSATYSGPQLSFAREIGRAVRTEFGRIADMPAETSSALERCRAESANLAEAQYARVTLRQLADLYGVRIDRADLDGLEFKAICRLREMLSRSEDSASGPFRHATDHRGTASSGADNQTYARITGYIAACSGTRPCDIAASALERLSKISSWYDRRSPFAVNVLSRMRSVLVRVADIDQSSLLEDPGLSDSALLAAARSLVSGLVDPGVNTDGTRRPFVLADASETNNPDSQANIPEYANYIDNPDFHKAMRLTLDALYASAAMLRVGRLLGFRPGDASDAALLGTVVPAGQAPLNPLDGVADAAVSVEQLADPDFDVGDASYFDQPFFTTKSPDAWLSSVMRPTFGGVSIRDEMVEERHAIAGFHHRSAAQRNLDARMYFLDCLPDSEVTAVDEEYESKFKMESGRTRHLAEGVREDADGRRLYKFFGYAEKKARHPATGAPIKATLADQRLCDILLKARKTWFQGGTYVITGVNGISFGMEDSTDPSYYERDKVRDRARDGRPNRYSDFDRALLRLMRQFEDDPESPWHGVTGADGLDMYDRLVRTACRAMRDAKAAIESGAPVGADERPMDADDFNGFVLDRLVKAGLVEAYEGREAGAETPRLIHGTVKIHVDEIEKMFESSATYRKLLDAGRRAEWLTREAYVRPHAELFREVKEFVDAHPYLTDGDGAFFHNVSTPLPFIEGEGVFMYAANRVSHDVAKEMSEAMDKYEKAYYELMKNTARWAMPAASMATDDEIRLMRDLFHLHETSPQAVRAAILAGKYQDVRGLSLGADSTVQRLAQAMYDRLVGMAWKRGGDPSRSPINRAAAARMARMYESMRWASDSIVTGGVGMTDEVAFRVTGRLPHNDQLGHAVGRAIDGVTNAFAYRAAVFNMATSPDEDGDPVCYIRPADDAERVGGMPDKMWGAVARWWCERNGLRYDPAKSGIANAQAAFDAVRQARKNGAVNGKKFGELNPEDIDGNAVTAVMARSGVPADESKEALLTGGYALGYAKHLFQASRALGPTWARAIIHRAMSYSKSLSVSFSYFFPLATRFESPVGAVGVLATLGGNFAPDFVRDHAKFLSTLQSVFRGKGWITKDFLGQRDVFSMMDSNDPYLAELHHMAGCIGLELSDGSVNPLENARGQLLKDVKRAVAWTEAMMGRKAAKRLNDTMHALLVRSSDRAFTYHLNATKLAVAAQLCQRLQIEAARIGKAFDPVRDLKRYSGYINAEIGGIDPLKYAWTNPKARSFMNMLFFSPPWTRGAWEAGGGGVVEQALFGGHLTTPEERMHFVGRAARMGLEVMYGWPMVMQFVSKALGSLMVAGLDPDDPALTEDQLRHIRMVRETPWFTWGNEEKIGMAAYDFTPIMSGVAAAFPNLARARGSFLGKVAGALPAIAAGLTGKPLIMLLSFPTYTGSDAANRTTRGRRYYQHFGKQGWEFVRWFTAADKQVFSKLSMPAQRLAEGVLGRSLSWLDKPLPWDDQGVVERWVNPSFNSAWFNLVRAFMPFSMASLLDNNDAGFVPLLGPVQMGQSTSAAIEKLSGQLARWSSDDRRGYAFGGPTKGRKAFMKIAQSNPDIMAVVRDAMRNGYSEKAAFGLVQTAMSKVTPGVYTRLVNALPDDPKDGYDTKEVTRLLRQLGRLGKKNKDMYKAVMNRMVTQNRWASVSPEARAHVRDLMRAAKMDPYRDVEETVRNWTLQMTER